MIDRRFEGGCGPDRTMKLILGLGQPDLSYEFNDFILWEDTIGGGYYFASDAGCSCPTPFENYNTLSSLERATSAEHVLSAIESWGGSFLSVDEIDEAKRILATLNFN